MDERHRGMLSVGIVAVGIDEVFSVDCWLVGWLFFFFVLFTLSLRL